MACGFGCWPVDILSNPISHQIFTSRTFIIRDGWAIRQGYVPQALSIHVDRVIGWLAQVLRIACSIASPFATMEVEFASICVDNLLAYSAIARSTVFNHEDEVSPARPLLAISGIYCYILGLVQFSCGINTTSGLAALVTESRSGVFKLPTWPEHHADLVRAVRAL